MTTIYKVDPVSLKDAVALTETINNNLATGSQALANSGISPDLETSIILNSGIQIFKVNAKLDEALGNKSSLEALTSAVDKQLLSPSVKAKSFMDVFASAIISTLNGMDSISFHLNDFVLTVITVLVDVETINKDYIRKEAGYNESIISDIKKQLISNDKLIDCFKDPAATINSVAVRDAINKGLLKSTAVTTAKVKKSIINIKSISSEVTK